MLRHSIHLPWIYDKGVGRRGRGPASGGRSDLEYRVRVKGDGQVPSRAGEELESEQTKSDEE